MRIVIDNKGDKYIDQDLFDYINQIWINYDIDIPNDSKIYYTKNTTVPKIVTDYTGNNITRVIKKEKAEYVVINRFNVSSFPQYFDGTCITSDDTKEVVYGIYNQPDVIKQVIEVLCWYAQNSYPVKYVNQDTINNSINNGFIITEENYLDIYDLINSQSEDNHKLAVAMLVGSDLSKNWEWIVYMFNKKRSLLGHDKKNIISNYIYSKVNGLGVNTMRVLDQYDAALQVVSDPIIKDKLISLVKNGFNARIQEYLRDYVGTETFILEDFKIRYNGK